MMLPSLSMAQTQFFNECSYVKGIPTTTFCLRAPADSTAWLRVYDTADAAEPVSKTAMHYDKKSEAWFCAIDGDVE